MKKIFNALKTTGHYILALTASLIACGLVSTGAYFLGGVTAPFIGVVVGTLGSFAMIGRLAKAYTTILPRGVAAGYTTAFMLTVAGNCAAGIHQDNKTWKDALTGGESITSTFNETHRPEKTIKKPSTAPSRRPQLQN